MRRQREHAVIVQRELGRRLDDRPLDHRVRVGDRVRERLVSVPQIRDRRRHQSNPDSRRASPSSTPALTRSPRARALFATSEAANL